MTFQVLNVNGQVLIPINYFGVEKQLTPTELLTLMIVQIKEIVEKTLGEAITSVVITIPYGFYDYQRQVGSSNTKYSY